MNQTKNRKHMKNSHSEQLIDDYLSGLLNVNDLNKFNDTINNNMELAKDLEFQQEIFDAIRDERKREIRTTLNHIHRKNTQRTSLNIYSWKLQAVAAALVVLIVTGGLLGSFLTNNTTTNQSLYTEYFNPETSLLSVRSYENIDSNLKEGMFYFEQGKFEKAISIFQIEPNDLLGKLYTGFSYMKLEEYPKAESQFKDIIKDQDNLFIDQAEWNLGLCYLNSGQLQEAKKIFERIAVGNTVYNKDADHILNEMTEE